MTPRLKTTYEKEIISKLMSKLNFKNKHEVPKIDKVIFQLEARTTEFLDLLHLNE